MISIVEIEHYKYNKQNKIGIWIKSLQIYYVDLSAIDFISDDRFCKIKNKRSQGKLLGLLNEINFPIVFPLVLNNGFTIENYEQNKYDEERE